MLELSAADDGDLRGGGGEPESACQRSVQPGGAVDRLGLRARVCEPDGPAEHLLGFPREIAASARGFGRCRRCDGCFLADSVIIELRIFSGWVSFRLYILTPSYFNDTCNGVIHDSEGRLNTIASMHWARGA